MSPSTPETVLLRQFRNLAEVRRNIYSLLPLRRARVIVEPGCGTGLLARELSVLTGAELVCIDRARAPELPDRARYVAGDARRMVPRADIYISSFFLYQLPNPPAYLRRARRALAPDGFYAAAGEFAYRRDDPLQSALADSLAREGFDPGFGDRLEEVFERAGFRTVERGAVELEREEPDREFLQAQLGSRAPDLPGELGVRVCWGVFRAE
jgi:SAM-dependent methyltransferase